MKNTADGTKMIGMLGKRVTMNSTRVWPGAEVRVTGITLNDDGSLSYLGRYTVVPDPEAEGMEVAFDHADIAEVR